MDIYRITNNKLEKNVKTTLSTQGIKESGDLKKLLRTQIDMIDPGIFIKSEEFRDWEDRKVQNDALGFYKENNLIIIEFKHTGGGGYMGSHDIHYAVASNNSLIF